MRHPGEDRQDHLRHLHPGQPRCPHRHPPLDHLRPHLDKPHTDYHGLDYRAEMGPHGKMNLPPLMKITFLSCKPKFQNGIYMS